MFVDEVIIKLIAGKGGDGCTSFRREKFIPLGGPNGGNGGKGADIIFQVEKGLKTLVDLKYKKQIKKREMETVNLIIDGKAVVAEKGQIV